MRTRSETVVVPEESYTSTHYGCDHCDFEADTEDEVKNHHAKTHSVKKETEVAGVKFLWFDSKEDAELYLDPPGDFGGTTDFTSVQWSEPGWYGMESRSGTGRCRCGGCSYFETSLMPVEAFVERWRHEISNHEKATEKCLSHIEEAQTLIPAAQES